VSKKAGYKSSVTEKNQRSGYNFKPLRLQV